MLRDHSFPAGSRTQDAGRRTRRARGREGEGTTACECVFLHFYFEDTRSISEEEQPEEGRSSEPQDDSPGRHFVFAGAYILNLVLSEGASENKVMSGKRSRHSPVSLSVHHHQKQQQQRGLCLLTHID